MPVDVDDRLGDQGAAAQQVQVAYPQRGHLAVADPGVGQEQDCQSIATGGLGELVDLLVGEEHLLPADRPGQRHAESRVAGQPAV
ncbi:MAG: hypothetical protein ACJ786_37390, partial [Catenulispora sp.]